jgi:AcrR family transcriptional regulator
VIAMTVDAEGRVALRQDARRNRERLIKAATEVFSEQGLDASLGEIARRAGVGDATLYRRFPTRADLYAAVYAEAQETIHHLGEQALLIEDGWAALSTYLESTCEFTATNRAVSDLQMATVPDTPSPVEGWERPSEILTELIDRAKRQGSLHPIVTMEDILVALYSVQLMVPASAGTAPDAWRRQLAFILRGLHANGGSALPTVPALTAPQLQAIGLRLFLRGAAEQRVNQA